MWKYTKTGDMKPDPVTLKTLFADGYEIFPNSASVMLVSPLTIWAPL